MDREDIKRALFLLSIPTIAFLVGKRRGYKKGVKKGEFMMAQAEALQIHNARFVEEQYEIINEKIKEVNRAQREIEDFFDED